MLRSGIVLLRRLLFVHVDGRTGNRPVPQGLNQVRLIDHVSPRSVDKEGRLLHRVELFLADASLCVA